MTAALLLVLAQAQPLNLNTQPLEVRQGGVKVPTRVRQWAVDCRGSATCTVDGGVWTLTTSGGGGGSPSVGTGLQLGDGAGGFAAYAGSACASGYFVGSVSAAGVVSCFPQDAGTAGGGVTSVSGSTFVGSTGGATPVISLNATGTPSGSTFLRGDNTWAAPPAGGSGNWGTFAIGFGDDAGVASFDSETKTVAAAWVSGTSDILFAAKCGTVDGGVTPEECSLVHPECTAVAQVASTSFDVRCVSEVGGFGPYFISFSGAN